MLRQLSGAKRYNLIAYDTYFVQVPTSGETSLSGTERQDVTNVRAAPRGRPLQLPLFSNKRLVLSPARLYLAPPDPASLQQPINKLIEKLQRSNVVPPTTIAGQKQLNPCPMTKREATVESTQLKKSSRNRRASRRNSFCRNWLPTLPNAAITRVPSRKCSSSIEAKRE